MVRNVDPNIEMIVTQDIEMTSDVNHADIAFACNSWMEFTYPEMTATVSNPADLEGRHPSALYDTRNDADTFGAVAVKLTEMTGDVRIRQVFHFVYMNRVDVYVQRMLDASATCYGYSADVMLKSEKGWMVMGRTYPRHPLWEETNESKPQWTRCGRIETYRIEPEAIEYGENFVVHREGPEATPYLPNAIMTSNPSARTTTGFPSRRSTTTTSTSATSSCLGRDQAEPEPVVGEGVSVLLRDPEDAAPGAQPVVGERLGADLRVELRRSVPDGQTDAGRRRAPVAHQPAGGQGPRHQRRRLHLCGRQPGGPAVPRLEALGSVLQGRALDDPV